MSPEGFSMTLAGRQFIDEGVLVIAHRVEGVEGISVIWRKHKAFPDAQRQIRICHDFFHRTQHRTESSHQSAVWILADRGIHAGHENSLM